MWLVPLRNYSSIACSWYLAKSCICCFALHLILTSQKSFLLCFRQKKAVSCRILILLFLYCMWLVPRGISLLLLYIVCVLHIAKSCFCWLNIAWCSHFAPCRVPFLLLLHCMQLTFWEVLCLFYLHITYMLFDWLMVHLPTWISLLV